ncbi:calcium-activated chloride channel regulator 1-like [Erinaceus europaeus]|uniref:Calcium-activated chloride channel regulator 1-like n=1 Tax=Erinaceus europaeus TaxID=9365 RepID=A0ABM3YBA4_ERIEU|nr:calcium-activated chloride channel regulator 1-like [Erinaceus europaeus]
MTIKVLADNLSRSLGLKKLNIPQGNSEKTLNAYSKSQDENVLQVFVTAVWANVIVANPYAKYGDDPYTLQYGQCGEKGQYIHFNPNFLLDNNIHVYGPRGRVLVHEWAHLRWGVFDEYNEDRPFYFSRKETIEATRCSSNITGTVIVSKCQEGICTQRPCKHDSQTGLYEADCTFIPKKFNTARESIMFLQSLNSVTKLCTKETHNPDAPNLQNKMCSKRSTWEAITKSEDFQKASPMPGTNPPPPPTFSLLRTRQHVVCLVLDKSGSMDSEERLLQMNQAAELFLNQIIEKESLVGMVTFKSYATIQNDLTEVTDDDDYQKITANLPQVADGGTSICSGLTTGFQVITRNSQSTSGSEIILLTDGEDSQISSCFEEVKQSGAIIHTIALGPSAAKELETLATMTGGHRFYAHRDINGLIDAFSRISSRSGSISQQAIQLESKTVNAAGGKWTNGTVPVDKTVGNDTFFVVTWTTQRSEIFLQDPKGKIYETSHFQEDKLNIRSVRLRIPGTAETGTWTYSLLNKHADSQLLTVTVTTRARDSTTFPVTATVHMSRNTAHYPSPMIVYARVSQGFLPVLGVNVTAIIEKSEDGYQVTLELWDNGAGADNVKNDGIYSRYFTDYHGNGRYSLKVIAQARKNTAKISLKQQNKALYIPGYTENGKIKMNPPSPEVEDGMKVQDFNRLTSGGSFTLSGAPSAGTPTHVFPQGRITDVETKFKEDSVQLSWTVPGNVLDKGKANSYIIRISKHFLDLQEDFDNATLVNTSSLVPKEAGSTESFEFKPEPFRIENGTKFYAAIRSVHEGSRNSEISNIAEAIKFIPPQEGSGSPGTNISAISLTIWVFVVVLSIY